MIRRRTDFGRRVPITSAVTVLALLALAADLPAAQQICYLGFETTGWEDEFTGRSTWEDHVVRVSNSPRSGSYCLRGNQNIWRVDPITGAYGLSNALLDWRGAGHDIGTKTPNEMYFSYWFRHDDHTWAGSESGDGKLFYFIDVNYSTRAQYVGGQLANHGLGITYSNGAYSDAWARDSANWGYSKLNLGHPNVSPSTTGTWRHFEYYINYNQHYFKFWVDGNLLKPTNGRYADGEIDYDPELDIHWKGFQFFYIHAAQVDQSSDGTGYYNGWQIDDLEVWDGMPGTQPTLYTLTVNSGTGDGQYQANTVVSIVADEAPSGQAFDEWVGDTSGIADVGDYSTTLTMPSADSEVTATYAAATTYALTVNSGSGDGSYQQGQIVDIAADAAPSGQVFDEWVGDTSGIADVGASSTTITMPAADTEITATYTDAALYTLTVNSGTGDGSYQQGYVVDIAAASAPSGQVFDDWAGDVGGIADVNDPTTTLTMPASNAEITATYKASGSEETMHFREGGGTGYTDVTFDDTYLKVNPADDTTRGTLAYNGLQADSSTEVALIAIKDLFTELPKTTGGKTISITQAKLHLFRYQGDGSATVQVYRVTTDWLPDSAGSNETDVSGEHAEVSQSTDWASGDFSSGDYDGSLCCTGSWTNVYDGEAEIDITDVVADIYDNETNYGIVLKATGGILGRASEYATSSKRPSIEITYQYPGPTTYTLTVNSGSGDGDYAEDQVVDISADAAPSGQTFDEWSGDTSGIADLGDPTTTMTMPAADAEITATYTDISYTLTVNSGSGDGSYAAGTTVDVTADTAPSGTTFDEWVGDTSGIEDVSDASTRLTMPAANTEITATYVNIYTLTVNSGSGDGTYQADVVVNIAADAAPSGYVFSEWTGDTSNIADAGNPTTTITMPAADTEITAWYEEDTELEVATITASEYEDPNVPANTQDKSLATRWSAPGYDGDWIKYDLGTVKTVAFVKIAWYLGDQRTADFDIDVSSNDSDWTQAYTGTSSGTTDELQTYDFADVQARYVRITGYGNSENHWNSITEVEIHGWAGVVYTLTVNSGTGDGDYAENEVVNISANAAPSGQAFNVWTGDVDHVAEVNNSATTVTMPAADVEITATYADVEYVLTVNSGTGDGDYSVGTVIDISADAAASGMFFDKWTGDTSGVADINDPTTTITMPAAEAELTATYTWVADGLVSRYTFDIDAGDSCGSNDGTLSGASVTNDGTRGQVLSLDGTDDYVDLPADAMTSGRSEVTLSLWIKPDEWVSSNTIWDEYAESNYWQFSIRQDTWFTRDSSTGTTGSRGNDVSMPSVSTGSWHHLAFVYSVAGGSKAIYYDGVVQGTSTASIDELTVDRDGARIGYACDGDNYDGLIDDVRLYNRALNSTEIAYLAEKTLYTLTVNGGTGSGEYIEDQVVNISAGAAPSGQEFEQWIGDTDGIAGVSSASTTLTMPAGNAEVTATYTDKTWTLAVNSGTGDGDYVAGTVVDIDADSAPSGQEFDEWIGDTTGIADVEDSSTTITMPYASVEITATYTDKIWTLTVNSGTGDGDYVAGTVVDIDADSAPSGQEFDEWVGDTTGIADVEDDSTTITMPYASVEITATYKSSLYSLTVNSGSGDGSYAPSTVVDITADTAPSGQMFDKWVGNTSGIADVNDPSTTLTMPAADVEVTATYTDIQIETKHFREGGGSGYIDVTFDDTYTDSYYEDETRGNSGNVVVAGSRKHGLIAIKDLFTELPKTTSGKTIVIDAATLHLFRYNSGSSSTTVNIYRCTTDWLPDSAGSNENDVCHAYAELSESTTWASGDFSSSDYDTANGVSGNWVSNYNEECQLDVTDVIADIYDAGTNYGMVLKTADGISFRASEQGTASLRPSLEVDYYYQQ